RSCRRHMSFMSRCLRRNPIHPLKVSRPSSIGRKEPMPARPTRRSSSTPKLSKNWTDRVLSMDCIEDNAQCMVGEEAFAYCLRTDWEPFEGLRANGRLAKLARNDVHDRSC